MLLLDGVLETMELRLKFLYGRLEGVGLEFFVLNGVLETKNLEVLVLYGQIERVDL